MCAYGQYIQWFPTKHYIISWANLHWREQQIALEQSPNRSSHCQAPYQGYIWSQLFFPSVMYWNIARAALPSPSTFELGKEWESGLKHFTWAPSLKKTAEEEQSKMSFQGWKKKKKKFFQCIWWVSRGLFATCVKGQVKHNRREKLGKATVRLRGSGCHHAATWTLPVTYFLTCALAPEPVQLSSTGKKGDGAFC